jgi:tripartite-type tricarboxylate transporter receptor subunit TctC
MRISLRISRCIRQLRISASCTDGGAALAWPLTATRLCCLLSLIYFCSAIPGAWAAPYPERPIRLIVPTPAGGGGDNVARILAPKLSEILGQQIVIDNRGGAGGSIGAIAAARAAPDGYTLLAAIASQVTDAAVMKTMAYDLQKDFAPVALTVTLPNVLVSHPALPAQTLRDVMALARARPGQLQVASGSYGGSSFLAMEYFLSMSGLRMINVPYKGVGPALVDVVAGHVPLMMGSTLSALPQIRNGRLRAYGVTSLKRSSGAPDIPTIAESGVPGYAAYNWSGLLAPAGMPRAIVMQLHAAVLQALQDPVVRKRFADNGADATPSASPEEFGAFIQAELAKWAKVVRDAGISPQ